jgi:hypothetical protein
LGSAIRTDFRRRRPAELEVEKAVTLTRILAILAGIAVTATLQQGFVGRWYVAFPAGVFVYLLARHLGSAIAERRRFKQEMMGVSKDGRPLSD